MDPIALAAGSLQTKTILQSSTFLISLVNTAIQRRGKERDPKKHERTCRDLGRRLKTTWKFNLSQGWGKKKGGGEVGREKCGALCRIVGIYFIMQNSGKGTLCPGLHCGSVITGERVTMKRVGKSSGGKALSNAEESRAPSGGLLPGEYASYSLYVSSGDRYGSSVQEKRQGRRRSWKIT